MSKKEAGTIFISLQLATAELRAGIRSLDQEFKKISTSAKRMGTEMSLAFSLPLAGIGRYATKSFGDFDQAMTNSLAIMGKVSDSMRKDLVEGAKQVAATTTISATEAATGYYELVSAGLSAGQALKALPIAADFATAGNLKLADATLILTRVQAAFGLSSKDPIENMKEMARVSDVVGRASIDTTLHIDELSNALASQVSGALRLSHTSLETATALLEAFGQQNITGAKAGTMLGIVVRELGIDFLKHAAAFKKAGIEVFNAKGNYNNLIDIIAALEKRFRGMSDAQKIAQLQTLGFTKRNSQAIQLLIGWSAQMKIWEQRNKEATGSIAAIANEMRKGFNAQMKIAMNNVQNAAIVIGGDLAPALLTASQAIARFAKAFSELPDWLRHTIELSAAFLALIGPIGLGVGLWASGFRSLLQVGSILAGVLEEVAIATGAVDLAASGLAIIITGGLIVALAGIAIVLYQNWGKIQVWFQAFKDEFPALVKAATYTWNAIKQSMVDTWDAMKGVSALLVDAIIGSFKLIAKGAILALSAVSPATATALKEGLAGLDRIQARTIEIEAANQRNAESMKKFIDAAGGMDNITKIADALKGKLQEGGKAILSYVSGFTEVGQAADKSLTKSEKKAQKNADAIKAWATNWLGLGETATKATGDVKDGINELGRESGESLDETVKGFEGVSNGAKAAAKAMDTLNQKLLEVKDKTVGKSIEEDISGAVDRLDQGAFQNLKNKLAESIKQASVDGLKNLVAKAGPANAEAAKSIVDQIGTEAASKKILELNEKWAEASKKNAEKVAEDQKAAYKDAVDFWEEAFSQATQKGGINLESSLKDLLLGFASSIAATFTDGMMGGFKNMKDIGGALGKSIAEEVSTWFSSNTSSGSAGSGSSGGIMGALGSAGSWLSNLFQGSSAAADYQPLVLAPGKELTKGGDIVSKGPGAGAYIGGGIQTGITAFNAGSIDKKNKNNQGTGSAIGAGIGTFIMPGLGTQVGSVIGGLIGKMFKWGPQNPETKARHAFANFIEDGFKKLGSVAFFDAKNKLQVMKGSSLNFLEGPSTQFNNPHWADDINKLGSTAKNTFLGLGEAMKEVLGLNNAVGAQLGALLAQNLGGNIDNARLLVQQLGLSLDDMVNKLVEVGVTGKESWSEVETQIQGVTEAFKPGLAAIGDVKGAFQELIDSGGRGMAAIKGVKDIAVEAMEAGAKTLDDLKGRLLKEGFTAGDVDAFMNALKQRGITTLQQLADVSNRIGGGIVADLSAGSKSMADNWQKMSDQLEDVSKKLQDLPTQIESNITLNVDANISDSANKVLNSGVATSIQIPASTKKFAKGGLLNRATGFSMGRGFGLAGEAGPEFLMPATMLPDGTMGVRALGGKSMGGTMLNITVNAPNASPGMEHKIVDALRRASGQIMAQTIDAIEKRQSRGGRY